MDSVSKIFSTISIFRIYAITIILLAILPLNSSGSLNNITILRFRGDYFLHALMFLPWAFFRPSFRFSNGTWLLLGLLFAAGSEALQYLLPYRAYNVNDLAANVIGVALSFPVYSLWVRFGGSSE